jgi:hypothetical protein
MATSNRDRIGQGFELLATGLQPFIDREVRAAMRGQDWLAMLQSRDGKRGSTWTYNRDDPLLLLRVLTEDAEIFKNRLSRPEQAFASELREVRNRWAHNEAFSPDDTYRALDTMERRIRPSGCGSCGWTTSGHSTSRRPGERSRLPRWPVCPVPG